MMSLYAGARLGLMKLSPPSARRHGRGLSHPRQQAIEEMTRGEIAAMFARRDEAFEEWMLSKGEGVSKGEGADLGPRTGVMLTA